MTIKDYSPYSTLMLALFVAAAAMTLKRKTNDSARRKTYIIGTTALFKDIVLLKMILKIKVDAN